jgi:hypothetical protein
MSQIYSSSAPLIAFFETGDVPTADNFESLIKSFAVYDGTLTIISGSSTSTGSFGQLVIGSGVNSNILPNVDNTHDLGSSTLEWKDLYIDGTAHIDTIGNGVAIPSISSSINISGSLLPNKDDHWDLGASGLEWKDLHLDGTANIDTLSNATATITTANITTANITTVGNGVAIPSISSSINISGSLLPSADNKWSLGTANNSWKDLHVQGTATIGTLSISSLANSVSITGISSSTQVLQLSGSFIPATDDTYNLGSSTQQWKDLYVDGVAYIDKISGSSGDPDSALTSSVHIVPGLDDTYNLGSSDLQWKDLHIDGTANIDTAAIDTSTVSGVGTITTASINNLSSSLIPDKDNTYDLGSSTREYKDIYSDGIIYSDQLGADGNGVALAYINVISSSNDSTAISSSVSLVPSTDDTYSLGSSTLQWKDLHLDGTANIDNLAADTASIGRVSTSLIPTADDAYDLGSSDFRYNEVYATSQSLSTSASLSAIKFENLPTSVAQARLIGTGSLYLSGSTTDGDGQFLCVFTG